MKTWKMIGYVLLCSATCAHAQDRDVPDKARREIERRGYLVQRIDDQVGDANADVLAEAFGVPADDSHKFTLTILYGAYRNSQLDKLKQHLLSAEEPQPWVRCQDRGKGSYDVASTTESHLHCRFDQHKNPFIPEQWSGIKVLDYPTLLLQPPRSGQWGPPETVVNQRTGYDGNAGQLAEWIRASIGKYALTFSQTPEYRAAHPRESEGHQKDAEAGRYPAPFPIQPRELPVSAAPASPFPPDLVPVAAQPLTSEQIKQIVPQADAAFVLGQLDAKVTTAAEVTTAWSAKALQEKLRQLEQRLEEGKSPTADNLVPPNTNGSYPVFNWLLGSGVLVLLLHMGLSYFGAYAGTTPTPLDDAAVRIGNRIVDALKQQEYRPMPADDRKAA